MLEGGGGYMAVQWCRYLLQMYVRKKGESG